jgi:tetratricopeptide (TPR) repeat protein/SAM-dependent methyltransferase
MNNKSILEETFKSAIESHQKNNLEVAEDLYNQILKIDPNYVGAINNLGVLFKSLGKDQKAKVCYEKAITINSNHTDAHNNLGVIFKELKEHQKAKDCFEKVIKIDPNHINALNNLGAVLQDLGEHQKAKDCFEKVIKIDPNYVAAFNNLGSIFFESGEYQKAEDYYKKAIVVKPNYANSLNNLGSTYLELEEYHKAKSCYEKAIVVNPNYISAYNNLGIIFDKLGDWQNAMDCYQKVLEINPEATTILINLSNLIKSYTFLNLSKKKSKSYKELFLFLYRKNNIDHKGLSSNAKKLIFFESAKSEIQQVMSSEYSLLKNEFTQNLLKEELFHLMLQKSLIADIFLEKLLNKIRCEILFIIDGYNKNALKEYFNFIISLAEQCWLNEYIYFQSDKEINHINKLRQKIESDQKINELEVAILGCYTPLNSSKTITQKLLDYKSTNSLFNDLISMQIKEPLREKELVKSIESLDEITDPVSKKVQEQYEEHPYPRWRYTDEIYKSHFLLTIKRAIKPNRIDHNDKFDNPNVLIAGCGTGRHPITTARYKNANILGVDLSLTSLAYAKRKTEELGFKNIRYLHADILELKKLNRKFDIIESVGTLHHMNDPVSGLKVLLDVLEPHGFLRLGLYSETARQPIVKAREFIKSKSFKNTSEDIKIFRQKIIDEKKDLLLEKVTYSGDFYSTSSIRDLLFHVQEHRFTILEISKILKDLNVEFLGFDFLQSTIKKEYSKNFPDDKKNISLDNWHQFEIKNPDIFIGMYQFWVRKI